MAILEPRRVARLAEARTQVPCDIRILEIEEVSIRGAGSKGVALRSSGKPSYKPRVEYEYKWNDKVYMSDRFWLSSALWNEKSDLEAIMNLHRPPKPAFCYIDPNNSAQAVLTRKLFERPFLETK